MNPHAQSNQHDQAAGIRSAVHSASPKSFNGSPPRCVNTQIAAGDFGCWRTNQATPASLRAPSKTRVSHKPLNNRALCDQPHQPLGSRNINGGERGIRTLGTLACSTVFETAPFNHSGTSPQSAHLAFQPGLCNIIVWQSWPGHFAEK